MLSVKSRLLPSRLSTASATVYSYPGLEKAAYYYKQQRIMTSLTVALLEMGRVRAASLIGASLFMPSVMPLVVAQSEPQP